MEQEPTEPTEPSIRVENLSRSFDGVTAVDGLTFSVKRGELFGLLGPDGAGKTTTLRMLAGVLAPSSGDALVLGKSVARDPEAVKHDIAYMSQRFGLYTDLTVLENISFYADLFLVPVEKRPERLERLFAFSGLGPFGDRLAGDLSGGMKQKLGLCCALIHRPEVLLLDEPTFGVDPISRRDLWLIVHEMVGMGTTVVVSTAYMDEAERFDRVLLLSGGRLQALDTPGGLRAGTEGEILEVRTPDPRRAQSVAVSIDGVLAAVVFGEKLHLTVSSAGEMAEAVERRFRNEGLEVLEMKQAEPGMEDIFIERVNRARRGNDAG